MERQLILPMEEKYREYLIDESKFSGEADSISFPATEDEVIIIVNEMRKKQSRITIQSGKTGIAGGAVPKGGHIMNLSELKGYIDSGIFDDGTAFITVEAGMNLMELNREISRRFKRHQYFWPPQPTEVSAAVGGILASGAKGINSCYYGDSRQYVQRLRMVTADGGVLEFERGADHEELDMILGGEGLTGVITAATLKLVPKPECVWGISFFFENRTDAGLFAERLKECSRTAGAHIEAAEYLDRTAIDLIEQRKETMTKIKELPDVPAGINGMVYLEIAGEEAAVEEMAGALMEEADECGSDSDQAWAVLGDTEIEKMQAFRHAAAETANLLIEEVRRADGRIRKLGTDMALVGRSFGETLKIYRDDIEKAGLKASIFGHIMNNHLHVNILPEDYQQYIRGCNLIDRWTQEYAFGDNCLAVEHGIGKLKNHLVDLILTKDQQDRIRRMKERYDPQRMWNQGNIFKEGR